MSLSLPQIYVVRHGETEWSRSGQHTGRTDIPLTPAGEAAALSLSERLRAIDFSRVLTSPSQRARRTCELSGFGAAAQVDDDLAEWDYGQYEGLRTGEILKLAPEWDVFGSGCPGGEAVADISRRADRAIARLRSEAGNVLVFSSGHILRVIAARWVGLDASAGRMLVLGTASVSILGYEHSLAEPAIRLWNS